jgi:histidyl-tRNA synthetase
MKTVKQGKDERRKPLGVLVKGFRDIEAGKRNAVKKIIEDSFRLYNFQVVETPIIEYEDFVKGENKQDDAISDIFKLRDKGKRKLALRYEFTFQLKRLAKNKKLPFRRYQIGEVFRDEPITGNRWRQFTQCDADIVGSSVKDEVEILKLISEILNSLGIKFTINLNNRKLLNEILDCEKIKDKEKVIKEIDKLDKLSEVEVRKNLKELKAEKIFNIFKKPRSYFKRYKSYSEIIELEKVCKLFKVKFNFTPSLARGLSYYTGTIFEVKGELKETIAAGGSYLVNGTNSTGAAFGLDRLEMLSKIDNDYVRVLVISLNQDKKAIEICDKIRKLNLPCQIYYGKPGKALDYANSLNIPLVVFIGEKEVKSKKFKIKNMNSGQEKLISERQLQNFLK